MFLNVTIAYILLLKLILISVHCCTDPLSHTLDRRAVGLGQWSSYSRK
jgi:hypothetical protein